LFCHNRLFELILLAQTLDNFIHFQSQSAGCHFESGCSLLDDQHSCARVLGHYLSWFAQSRAKFTLRKNLHSGKSYTPVCPVPGKIYTSKICTPATLEILKHFASLCKSVVEAVLPFTTMDKLCHGLSAGKHVVASLSALHQLQVKL